MLEYVKETFLAFKTYLELCKAVIKYVIYQTLEKSFIRISKHPEERWNDDAQWSIFDKTWGVWIGDEILSQVFDISSQSKQNNYKE